MILKETEFPRLLKNLIRLLIQDGYFTQGLYRLQLLPLVYVFFEYSTQSRVWNIGIQITRINSGFPHFLKSTILTALRLHKILKYWETSIHFVNQAIGIIPQSRAHGRQQFHVEGVYNSDQREVPEGAIPTTQGYYIREHRLDLNQVQCTGTDSCRRPNRVTVEEQNKSTIWFIFHTACTTIDFSRAQFLSFSLNFETGIKNLSITFNHKF